MDRELLALCKQTVSLYAFTSTNNHNDSTWSSTPSTFYARVQNKDKVVRNDSGQEFVSSCQIYCDGSVSIALRDKITCSAFRVTYPEILAIEKVPSETGAIDHLVIYTK